MVRSWRACCGRRGGAGRGVSSWRVCGRRACRTSCGPRGDAGNNPCSRQGDRVVAPTDACSSSRASVWSDDPNALATRRGCRISPAPRPSFGTRHKMGRSKAFGKGSATNQSPRNGLLRAAADICDSLRRKEQRSSVVSGALPRHPLLPTSTRRAAHHPRTATPATPAAVLLLRLAPLAAAGDLSVMRRTAGSARVRVRPAPARSGIVCIWLTHVSITQLVDLCSRAFDGGFGPSAGSRGTS